MRQKGQNMSVFRVGLSGKGISSAVQIKQEGGFTHIIAGNSDICAGGVSMKEDTLCFEVGHAFGCSDEFDEFLYELAVCLPDTEINFYWHSTMSGMSGSYNIGFMDGEYDEWDDDEVYPYCAFYIKHDGIGKLLKCGEKDSAGFTHVWVNDKEFWLNDLHVVDDCIWFNNAEKGSRSYNGIEEELTKAVPDHELIIDDDDFMTGDVATYKTTYINGEFSKQYLRTRDVFDD